MSDKKLEEYFVVSWSDCDVNGHMRHSSFLDKCADVRIAFLFKYGFNLKALNERKIGIFLMKEFAEYRKEVLLRDKLTIDAQLIGTSEDCTRWAIQHTVYREKDKCAIVCVEGSILDLNERKILSIVPQDLIDAFSLLPKSKKYKVLNSRRPNFRLQW